MFGLKGDWSLEDKVTQVLAQIERGEARIVFDPSSETASCIRGEAMARAIAAGSLTPLASTTR